MKKYEYITVQVWELKDNHNNVDKEKLNQFGRNGWELVEVIGGEAIFKRNR